MAQTATATRLEFRLLGPLEVLLDGRHVPLTGTKQRALLASLLLHANEPVSSERLIEELWDGSAPQTAQASLRVAVGKLRQLLEDEQHEVLETVPGGYRLQVEAEQSDVWRFETLVAQARSAPARRAAQLLDEALALWRGPPLADLPYHTFVQNESRRLSELHLAAREELIEAKLALGQHARVVAELESLVAEHPLREQLRAQLMLALYGSGRQAEALEVYQEGRRKLLAELGLEPGEDLRRLEHAILTQDPALGHVPTATEEQDSPEPERSADGRGWRSPRRLALLAACLLAGSSIAAIVALRHARSSPTAVAVPPHSLVVVDPRTSKLTRIPLDWPPAAFALGTQTLWALDTRDQIIARIDPQTRRVVQSTGLGIAPTSVTIGAGAVWVLGSDQRVVLKIDPAYGFLLRTRHVPLGNASDISIGNPTGIATGGNAVWIEDGASTLFRVDPATGTVTRRLALGSHIDGVAFGAGSVWVVRGTPPMLLRVDPSTAAVTAKIQIAARRGVTQPFPIGVAVGEGAVWVLNGNTGTVTRVDPTLDAVSATVSRVSLDATRIAAGAGAIWVADADGEAVLRIDPKTNRVVQTIPVGGTPTALAAGTRALWVAVDST
jgi:DNA-binding SARP family transcriptional activator/streptogramin lyase